jgi:hypothetical protein
MTNAIKNIRNDRYTTVLKAHVHSLFKAVAQPHGSSVKNPVTGVTFVWGEDPISEQKQQAWAALSAQEHFARFGPPDAPPLPLTYWAREDLKRLGPLAHMVRWFARSLENSGYSAEHPPFDDYASGVLYAFDNGLWITSDQRPEFVAELKGRFPPRPLPGLAFGLVWYPPKEFARLKVEHPSFCGPE